MADKTYKMAVTLSDNSTVEVGTFVAPQGPKGEKVTKVNAVFREYKGQQVTKVNKVRKAKG